MSNLITTEDLNLTGDLALTKNQLKHMLKKTPEKHIKTRPAKGGGQWRYVSGSYVKKVLNLMFGWDWDFEVIEHKFDLEIGQAYVLGKLKCRFNGREITKMQFGRVDIKFRKGTKLPLDIGNDLKAATTDALKKCASEIGIASDIYAQEDFAEVTVVTPEEKNNYQEQAITKRLEIALKAAKSNEEIQSVISDFKAHHPITDERQAIINNYV